MSITEEQRTIIHSQVDEILLVSAYAGSGKTFTLQRFAEAHRDSRILYLAFNKSMASEAGAKFAPLGVRTSTIHSLAFHAYGKRFTNLGNPRPHDLAAIADHLRPKNTTAAAALILQWVNAYMSSAARVPSDYVAKASKDALGPLTDQLIDPEQFGHTLDRVWADMQSGTIAAPHNAYLKLFQLKPIILPYDYILIDEAQDVTDAMIDIALTQPAKKIFIGDPYQQIYGWNGAVNALQKLAAQGYPTLYLSQSFRCPQQIADVANQYLRLLGASKPFKGCDTPLSDSSKAFISRSNAGVFAYAAERLGMESFHFLGGFDGYEFRVLLDMAALREGRTPEVRDEYLRRFQTFEDMAAELENAADAHMLARANIAKRYGKRVKGIYFELESNQVARNKATMVLTTGHKSKGQEFGHVTLADDFLDVSEILAQLHTQNGKTISVRQEELNLLYVSLTRAKRGLSCNARLLLSNHQVSLFRRHVEAGTIKLI